MSKYCILVTLVISFYTSFIHHSSAQWLTHGGDIRNRRSATGGTINPVTVKLGLLKQRWKFLAGFDITATPAVADGVVYFPSWNGNLYAVWQWSLGPLTGIPSTGQTVNVTVSRSTPAVANDLLIVGIYGPAYVVAVTRATGQLVWLTRLDPRPLSLVTCSGTVYNGRPMRHHIAKLVKDGLYREAIALYTRHHSASVPPTNFTFPYILKACAALNAVPHGQMLHSHLLKSGHTNKHTTTDLTNMYMKLGLVDCAAQLFDEIPDPSLAILNVVVSGFLRNGLLDKGFRVFEKYSVPKFRIDSVTIASVASVCGDVLSGEQLHCLAVRIGVERDEYASTSLMKMYLNFGELGSAATLFGFARKKSLVFYNAYLSGLAQNEVVETVLCVFKEMVGLLHERPDVITLTSVLSSCGNGECIRFGKQLHGLTLKIKLHLNTNVGTGLVDMYSKCGFWKCAYSVFLELGNERSLVTWNSMIAGMMLNDQSENAVSLFVEFEREVGLEPDPATWNSMISGFSQLGKADESLLFFRKMVSCGVTPSVRCLTSLLATCSLLSALYHGKQIHAYVSRLNIIDDEFLATAVIDMYMKCGRPSLAHSVFNLFDKKPHDPAFWNAMISGYGKHGKHEEAFEIFKCMVEERVKPNLVTFSCLLSVCSYTGQVDRGFEFFRLMTIKFGLKPTSKHMNILIDLLSRSGRLDEALDLLRAMSETSATVLASILGFSKHYLDSEMGEEMAQRILELEPENPIPFVVLSNIYAGQERWKDVQKIRKLMEEKGLKKNPGFSSIVAA